MHQSSTGPLYAVICKQRACLYFVRHGDGGSVFLLLNVCSERQNHRMSLEKAALRVSNNPIQVAFIYVIVAHFYYTQHT